MSVDEQRVNFDCHLSEDSVLLDLFVDESGAYEADEAAHGGSSQTQNSLHLGEKQDRKTK